MPLVQDNQHPQDHEERRLLELFEKCHAESLAAADELANPRCSMLYPTYKRLADALAAIQLRSHDLKLAIRAHRKRMRDGGK
jgi:hypothetical protein